MPRSDRGEVWIVDLRPVAKVRPCRKLGVLPPDQPSLVEKAVRGAAFLPASDEPRQYEENQDNLFGAHSSLRVRGWFRISSIGQEIDACAAGQKNRP